MLCIKVFQKWNKKQKHKKIKLKMNEKTLNIEAKDIKRKALT